MNYALLRSVALLGLGLALTACKDHNTFVPPPPAQVTIAPPLQEKVTNYLELTGNLSAYNEVDLVARVQGFLQEINYVDGAQVKKGDQLFVIEPLPYLTKLQQAQATQEGAEATLKNAQIELERQQTLVRQDVSSQRALDDARAARDNAAASLDEAKANVQTAAINYTYTRVLAPFDGKVSAHRQSVGQLVGTTPDTLATIVQQAPIYVDFTVSETDLIRVRETLRKKGWRLDDIEKVPVEIGLQTEKGYPHAGHLDYAAPTVNQSTGTLQVRGILENKDFILLPGYFARVRVPIEVDVPALLVPNTAIGTGQGGAYVLVVDKDNTVQQRNIQPGALHGTNRVILSGLTPDDRVIVGGIQRAVPGNKVEPKTTVAAK